MVEAIKTARAFGDLSENFEYHAAKNEQGLLERRITMLRDRLSRAVLVDEDAAADDTVGVGSKVELEDEQGGRLEVEISSVGGVSPDSPVGQALLGAKAGRRGRDRGAERRLARPRDLRRPLASEAPPGGRRFVEAQLRCAAACRRTPPGRR